MVQLVVPLSHPSPQKYETTPKKLVSIMYDAIEKKFFMTLTLTDPDSAPEQEKKNRQGPGGDDHGSGEYRSSLL
jgi:hypothetical protein